jgi:hypothetical protein
MKLILYIFLVFITAAAFRQDQDREEIKIVQELFRLRNEHKADSAEQYFADTVKVYMKYLRNVPKETITKLDKQFFKAHPKNKFEITAPLQITDAAGIATVTIIGKEYLDGTSFQYEKIEIKFDEMKKINHVRAFKWK